MYKGKLRATGEDVAVKVQRPFVLETVSLDLYLLRNLGLQLRKVSEEAARVDMDGHGTIRQAHAHARMRPSVCVAGCGMSHRARRGCLASLDLG